MLLKGQGGQFAWNRNGYLRYLVNKQAIEENTTTLIPEQDIPRQADRPYLWKRCLKTNQGGTDEITLTEAGISTGYTLLFWAKFNSVSHNHYIVQKRNPSIAPSEGYYMYSPAGGNVYFGFQAGGSINFGSDWRVLDEWHLYGITFSGTGLRDVTVFRDGVQIATGNTGVDYVPCTNGQNLRLANDSYGIADCYWKNVKQFLGDALTAEEQLAIYKNADVQITPTTEYLFEEGAGLTVYASDGTEGTITTSNINAVRVEQEDAPLLPNSGDVVGFSDVDYGYFNQNANNVASADVSDLEIDDFVLCFYFRKDGSDGVTQGICGIQAQTRATLGQSGYFIQTNTSNSLVIVFRKIGGGTETIPIGTVLQSKKWNHVVIYKNGTDLNYSLNGVSGNPTLTFSEIDWTSTSKLTSFGGYATNTFSFTEGQVSVTQFQLGEYSTANVNAALAQETLPSLIADIPFSDGSGTTLTNNEGTNLAITVDDIEDFWKKQYSPSNGVTDVIFNRPLTHTGRKDFPLTPYQEPAYKGTSTDYATMSQYEFLAEEEYIIEWLQLNYTNASTGTILGNQASDNFIIGLNSNSWYVRLNDTPYQVDTTLDLSDVSNFRVKYKLHNFTGTSSSITAFDIEAYIYDLDGNELASDTSSGELCGGTIINMMFASNTTTPTRFITGNIPWIKFYVDDVLTNHWEYLGNNSLIIWDRTANKNHATITTSNITANQGTQDVYSSRLKDGYSESLYFRDGGQVAAANNTIQDETTGDFTLLSWVRVIRDSAESSIGDDQVIIGKGSIGAGNQYGYFMYLTNGALRGEMVYNGTRYPTDNDTGVDLDNDYLGQWVLAATTFDRSGNLTAKIVTPNGTVHSSTGKDISAQDGNSITNTNTFKLGSGFIYTDRELDGSIYQAAKFNSLLTESELIALHTAGLKHSFASNIGDYTSSGNLTGHWISPSGINDTWEDTQGTDNLTPVGLEKIVIPANLLNNGLDIFANTLTNPSGVYLPSDIKLTSPVFRTLDTALESNEELYRDTTDANGNVVKDRLLIPISYNHSDKGFPAFDTNNGDYAMFTPIDVRNDYGNVGGQTNRFEALIIDYNSSRMIMGNSLSANRAFGFQFGDVIAWHNGSSIYQVDCGLGLASRTEPFIAIWEWTVESVSSAPQVTNIYLAIQDLQGNILFESNGLPSNNTANAFAYLDTIGNKGGTLGDPIDATIAYIKYYKNDVITHWWQYAGNNSFLVQDVVGDNHGSITTADITLNQGEQDVFNCFVDGVYIDPREYAYWNNNSSKVQIPFTRTDFSGGIIEFDVWLDGTSTCLLGGVGSGGGYNFIGIATQGSTNTNIGNGYTNLYIDGILTTPANRGEFYNALNKGRWVNVKYTGVDLSVWSTFVTGINLGFYSASIKHQGAFRNVKIDLTGDLINEAEYLGYGATPFTDITGNTNDGTISGLPDVLVIDDKILPQHPYNGLDIFDNTLTTPRSKERTKSLKYTDND